MNFPEEFLDLFNTESKAWLFLATIMPDGSPQVTPVWFDTDGEYVLVNTNEGRVKDRNMKARPQVAMTLQDPNDFYRYLGMRGEVDQDVFAIRVEPNRCDLRRTVGH